jgi:hypothetical protein
MDRCKSELSPPHFLLDDVLAKLPHHLHAANFRTSLAGFKARSLALAFAECKSMESMQLATMSSTDSGNKTLKGAWIWN